MNDSSAADAPPPEAIQRLLKLVGGPRDHALLHHALGVEWLKAGNASAAKLALEAALARDPNLSASWKLLGKARLESGDADGARGAWQSGIAVAEGRGDLQAAKEMQVFLRRLDPR
jgi:predicted Zn-dependent protease